jgi:hypothetical protein
MAAALLMAALLFVLPAAAQAENPCDKWAPQGVGWVKCFVWTGTVTKVDPGNIIEMRIDHVFASDQAAQYQPLEPLVAGGVVSLPTRECFAISGLQRGLTYLVATAGIAPYGPNTMHTVIWHVRGSRVELVHMYASEYRLPAAFKRADTLAEAVAIVAPGAELPPTDAVALTPLGVEDRPPLLPLVIGGLVALLFLLKPRVLRNVP